MTCKGGPPWPPLDRSSNVYPSKEGRPRRAAPTCCPWLASLDSATSGTIFYQAAQTKNLMAMSRDQKGYNAVAVEPPVVGELAESVMKAASTVAAVEPSPDEGLSATAAAVRDPESPAESVERFFDLIIDELSALRTRAEVDSIERAADLILECESKGGRVHVTGIGKSEHIARYIASLLSSTGTPAYFLHATECIHGSAGQVCSNDVVIAISNSGATPELLSAIGVLKDFDIKIVGVSGNPNSELAQIAEVLLDSGVDNEGGALNLVPRASILAKIYVLCSLSVSLEAHKGLTREQYARWHPGGALGRLARGE
jgi:D-arabinose 5-phosphate isomerase GutQ